MKRPVRTRPSATRTRDCVPGCDEKSRWDSSTDRRLSLDWRHSGWLLVKRGMMNSGGLTAVGSASSPAASGALALQLGQLEVAGGVAPPR
jgi:hypothetical protein